MADSSTKTPMPAAILSPRPTDCSFMCGFMASDSAGGFRWCACRACPQRQRFSRSGARPCRRHPSIAAGPFDRPARSRPLRIRSQPCQLQPSGRARRRRDGPHRARGGAGCFRRHVARRHPDDAARRLPPGRHRRRRIQRHRSGDRHRQASCASRAMSARCRHPQASRKARRCCAAGIGAQFTRLTMDDWLDQARRNWWPKDGQARPVLRSGLVGDT